MEEITQQKNTKERDPKLESLSLWLVIYELQTLYLVKIS